LIERLRAGLCQAGGSAVVLRSGMAGERKEPRLGLESIESSRGCFYGVLRVGFPLFRRWSGAAMTRRSLTSGSTRRVC
jgi:hypothetical protein